MWLGSFGRCETALLDAVCSHLRIAPLVCEAASQGLLMNGLKPGEALLLVSSKQGRNVIFDSKS